MSNETYTRRSMLKASAATGTTLTGILTMGSASAKRYEHILEVEPDSDGEGNFRAVVWDVTDFSSGSHLPNQREITNKSDNIRFEATVEKTTGWFDWGNEYSCLYFDSINNVLYIQEYDSNVTVKINGWEIPHSASGKFYY